MPGEVPYKPEQAQLAVATESSQDSAATSGFRLFGYVQEATSLPDPQINWVEERIIGGTREIFNKVEGQNVYEGGSVPITPYDGAPVAYLLGSDSVASDTDIDGNPETGTHTHTITALTNDLPPTQTIEATYKAANSSSASDFVRTFTGAAPVSGEIAINNEQELTTSLEYMAMGVSTGTSQTQSPSVPSRDPWLFHDAVSDLNLFGTSFARVSDFSLGVTNNLEDGRYIESAQAPDPFEITYGVTDYDLSATITVDDNTIYNELITQSNSAFTAELEFEKPGSGENLRITCNNCDIESAPHDIPAEETTVDVDVSIIPESVTIKVEDTVQSSAYV